MQKMGHEHGPARHTAFLASGEALESTCRGTVSRILDRDDEVEVDATACAPSYLVVADAWFPGWEAEVDGQPAVIERADIALRAVKLAPGAHAVRMRYRPRSFRWGAFVSGLTLAVLAIALARERLKNAEGGPKAAPQTASAGPD